MTEKSVLLIFLDGVGLGDTDPEVNPFMNVSLPHLSRLLDVSHLTREAVTTTSHAALLAVDACLGVTGLPQSGTGQTTILTGLNAPALLGQHIGPYATPTLRRLINQESLFRVLTNAGYPVAYANAYPDRFLDRMRRGKGRLSVNTTAAAQAGLEIRGREALQAGQAIAALLANDHWPEPDVPLPDISPYQAGQNLARLSADYTLTFFEFWYSDFLGHKMKREKSLWVLARLDAFFGGVLAHLNPHQLLLVISDHGNFENWTTKRHTLNPSLGLLAGPDFVPLVSGLQALTDVKKTVLTYLFDSENIPILSR